MESESSGEIVRDVSTHLLAEFEVIPHQLLIHGVNAILDDAFGTLARILAAEVCYALFSSEDLDRVLAMVEVRHHRHESRDLSTLLDRWAREDGEVSIAAEVCRATDTVHHLGAHNMCRVDITEDVGLEGSIHGDKA